MFTPVNPGSKVIAGVAYLSDICLNKRFLFEYSFSEKENTRENEATCQTEKKQPKRKSEMESKKICVLTSEVSNGELEDLVQYNLYRKTNKLNRFFYLGLYATINGYHHFKVKPEPKNVMHCIRVPDNKYDGNAIKVVLPSNDNDEVIVGRVPKIVCEIATTYIDNGDLVSSKALYLGEMSHGASTDFGLGPKLNCIYFFEFKQWEKRNQMKAALLNSLQTCKTFPV